MFVQRDGAMTRLGQTAAFAAVLTACAGPPASGQATPVNDGGLERIHMYEVPAGSSGVDGAAQSEEAGWIQVSGSGSVQVEPDRARVSFAMETRAETADQAASTNANAMDAVLRAIRAGAFEGLVLQTFGYSLQPEYATNNNRRSREIVAYTALNNVSATIDDVDAVGRAIDIAIGAGANRVSSISFFASNTEAARAEALSEAVRNAREQAQVIAESLGYRLGRPLEINGGGQTPRPTTFGVVMSRATVQGATTPIEAGEQTVTANVSIRFALGPELGG